jgi:hypothetical protein
MTSTLRNVLAGAAVFVLPVLLALQGCQARWPKTSQSAGRTPVLYPDYGDTVVAPNVAPLNIQIKAPGVRFRARRSGEKGGESKFRPATAPSVGRRAPGGGCSK